MSNLPSNPSEELAFVLKLLPDAKELEKSLEALGGKVETTVTNAWNKATQNANKGMAQAMPGGPIGGPKNIVQDVPQNAKDVGAARDFKYNQKGTPTGDLTQDFNGPGGGWKKTLGGMLGKGGPGGGFGNVVRGFLGSGGGPGGMQGALEGMGGGMAKMAGPIGIAMAVVGKVAGLAASGLQGVASSLRALQGPLGPVGMGFKLVGEAVGKIPIIGDAAKAAVGALESITESLVSMAGVASPGAFKVWKIALMDVQGVIGQAATPALKLLTEGVRFFGDVLATILPNQEEANEALSDLKQTWHQLREELRNVMEEIGPTLRGMVIQQIKFLAGGLIALAHAARGAMIVMRPLISLLGSLNGGREDMRSSTGAAAQPAKIQGLEEYQRNLQLAAYSLPGGTDINTNVQGIGTNVTRMVQHLGQIVQFLANPLSVNVLNMIRMGAGGPGGAGGNFDPTDPLGIRRAMLGF